PPPPELDTLSLHDALPISRARGRGGDAAARELAGDALPRHARAARAERAARRAGRRPREPGRPALRRRDGREPVARDRRAPAAGDRKSTRLNSSHVSISYA